RWADHHHHAARHVLAAMVAGALHHRDRARVSYRKPLTGNAAEVALAADGAIEHRVADNDALFRHDPGVGVGARNDLAAREALADVVVGLADKVKRDALRQPGAEALPGGAVKAQPNRIFRQAAMAVALGYLAR